jgi:hypothetical protein
VGCGGSTAPAGAPEPPAPPAEGQPGGSEAPSGGGETAPPSPEGCGAAAAAEQRYIARSADECARIRFVCEAGEEYFSNDCGCGCQKTGAPPQ